MYAPEQANRSIRWSSLLGTLGAVALLYAAGWSAPMAAAQGETDNTQDEDTVAKETPAKDKPLEYVHMQTSLGDIVLELNREKAPLSVANFLAYTENDYYNETIFHRVMSNFMIQGGGFTSDLQQKKTNKPVRNEAANGLSNLRGTIAMARTNDPHSATSQFFINVKDNARLDKSDDPVSAGYCVFGQVIAGMDTVDTIRNVGTVTKGRLQNVPIETVLIEEVTKITKERAEELKTEMEKDTGGDE